MDVSCLGWSQVPSGGRVENTVGGKYCRGQRPKGVTGLVQGEGEGGSGQGRGSREFWI